MRSVCAAILLLCLAAASFAQEIAAPAAGAPRYELVMPPGFELLKRDGLQVLCTPADKPWVEKAVATLQPATRPSTMPADVLTRLQAEKTQLVEEIAERFAVEDTAGLTKAVDALEQDLRKLQAFQPPIFYMVTDRPTLKALINEEKWTSPSFYYNRIADDVMYRETVPLTTDRPMDDAVVATTYDPSASEEAKIAAVQKSIQSNQREIEHMISGRAQFLTQMQLVDILMKEVFNPLELGPDQQWLAAGLAGVMSAEYGSPIIGSTRDELLLLLSAELRKNPIKTRTINLLKPAEPSSLKKQYVVAYADAYRRKSMQAAYKLLKDGRDKVPALMKSIRENKPANGVELVKRVTEITGVDLSADVAEQ